MFQLPFDVLGEKGIIIIIRIVRITHAGTTLVSNSFNFNWNPKYIVVFQLKLNELLSSVVPAPIIIIPFSPKTSTTTTTTSTTTTTTTTTTLVYLAKM